MKIKRILLAASIAAILLTLGIASVANAGGNLPVVSGAVGFLGENGGLKSYASFAAKATGPTLPGEEHQPASGFLLYHDESGLTFLVSVEHIHAHSATEVHFGGSIVKSNDPSLVGMFAHAVAIDGRQPRGRGDAFSIIWTAADAHVHGAPQPVIYGNLIVRAG